MKSYHYIILIILLALAGWVGYLLKTCPDEYPPEFVYIQDTKKSDSLKLVIVQQEKELALVHDTVINLKVNLESARSRVKKVFLDNPCPEAEIFVAESDSACDEVIRAQGSEIAISSIIIAAQDSVIELGIDLHRKDSNEVVRTKIDLFKAKEKVKRKNTWIIGMLGVLAGVVGVVVLK